MTVERRFIETVRREDLLPRGIRVVAAVSGGSDSVGMLLLLDRFSRHMKWTVSVLHVDHGMRPDSGRDAAFVEELANDLRMEFRLRSLPRRARSAKSPEAEFSAIRQAIYEDEAGEGGLVAVAHTASDRAETLLLRLLEGSGLRGLGGMDYRGVGPVRRPVLDLTRTDLAGYVALRGMTWVEDETNAERRFTRNRIRRGILAALEEEFPGCTLRLAASSANLASWRRMADSATAAALRGACLTADGCRRLDRPAFASIDRAVRISMLWELCGRPRSGLRELEKADRWIASGGTGSKVLPGGMVMEAFADRLEIREGRRDRWS